MDFNNLLKNKNIAILSFALFCIIALSLFTDSVVVFIILILTLAGAISYYLLNAQRKKEILERISDFNEPDAAIQFTPITSTLKLSDVAGLETAKDELFEIKDYLNQPARYKSFNARIPKGVLLVGPPGVGKTMIAKALAGEAGVPFFYQSGSSFVEIYVGMGAKKVHELFKTAKRNAPSIIFIDEIDSVGKARGGNRNDEREATLNQLLTEMDGFESDAGVVVIAATNKVEMLDEALLRAGRFDRHVHLSLPSLQDRTAILKVYLDKIPHKTDIALLASITSGFSGAALENLVNEAALYTIKEGEKSISTEAFLAVKDKVQYGKKQPLPLSEEEKAILAYYQSAKAVTAKSLGLAFEKITLFENSFLPDESTLESDTKAIHKIAAQLSGIIAYDLHYKMRFNNIKEDLEHVNGMIRAYLDHFDLENGLDYGTLLEMAKDLAAKTIKKEKTQIDALQKELMADEVIMFDAIQA